MGAHDVGRDAGNVFNGITLCVIGRSGTGKTALISKLASIARAANDQRPVLIRFCGTSKGSVNGLSLVQSLCHQIQLVLQLSSQPVSNNYDEAVLMFQSLLNQHAMMLFIDRLAIYPRYLLDKPCQHTFSIHSQYTSSMHSINQPSHPTLYTHLFNPVSTSFVMKIKLVVKSVSFKA